MCSDEKKDLFSGMTDHCMPFVHVCNNKYMCVFAKRNEVYSSRAPVSDVHSNVKYCPGVTQEEKEWDGGVIKKVNEEPKEQYKTNMLSIYICMLATCNLMFLHPYFNPHSF